MEIFTDEKRMKELARLSIDELIRLFKAGPAARRDMLPVAKMASSSLASVMRIYATRRQEDAMRLSLLRYVSKDEKEFKKYLSVSMPELRPLIEQKKK